KIDRWYPSLAAINPKAKEYLLSIQHFTSDPWLLKLSTLSNINKHRTLSLFEKRVFCSLVIKLGSSGLRFGELGLKSCSVIDEGSLMFKDSHDITAEIKAPFFIDANTTGF